MVAFLTLFRDSLRECADQRGLQVLLLAAILMLVGVASFQVKAEAPEDVIRGCVEELDMIRWKVGLRDSSSSLGLDIKLERVRNPAETDALPGDFPKGTLIAELALEKPQGMDVPLTNWASWKIKQQTGSYPDPPSTVPVYTPEDRCAYLVERFQRFGYDRVHAWQEEPGGVRFLVAAGAVHPEEVQSAHAITLLFGAAELPMEGRSLVELGLQVRQTIVGGLVGFIGLLTLLSVAAASVPDLLARGGVELLLARPLGRARILLYKYLGFCLGVLLLSLLTFAALESLLARSTGVAFPWFLASALTLSLNFAILFAAAVLVGVVTRSQNMAVLIPLAIGALSLVASTLHQRGASLFEEIPALRVPVAVAYHTLPNVADFAGQNARLLGRSLSPDLRQRLLGDLPEVNLALGLGTSMLFSVACLAAAAWWLRRQDL